MKYQKVGHSGYSVRCDSSTQDLELFKGKNSILGRSWGGLLDNSSSQIYAHQLDELHCDVYLTFQSCCIEAFYYEA